MRCKVFQRVLLQIDSEGGDVSSFDVSIVVLRRSLTGSVLFIMEEKIASATFRLKDGLIIANVDCMSTTTANVKPGKNGDKLAWGDLE